MAKELEVMTDLETCGTKPGCIIVSIGAVKFDRYASDSLESILQEADQRCFYRVLDLGEQAKAGQNLDPSTMQWWMSSKVDDDARAVWNAPKVPVEQALADFYKFCVRCPTHWSNGPSFDMVILRDLYEAFDMKFPTEYWKDRCCRTSLDFGGQKNPKLRALTAHNALEDSIKQVLQVQHDMRQIFQVD